MSFLVYLPLGVLPSVCWLWLIHRRDDHEREPWLLVLVTFSLGALSTVGVLWLRPQLESMLYPISPMFDAFVVTAMVEEGFKLLALLPLLLHRELDEPMDGVVYGAAIGLGFAAVENVLFAEMAGSASLVLQRAFTSTLMHACCTGCLGFCLARAKFAIRMPRAARAALWSLAGLVLAVTLHGFYDLFLTGERALAMVSLLIVLPTSLLLLAAKVRWSRARSRDYHPTA